MSQPPLHLVIHGAAGRMGLRLIQLIAQDPTLRLAAAIDRPHHPALGNEIATLAGTSPLGIPLSHSLATPADAAIDFSAPAACIPFAHLCAESKTPLVVGTTGLETADLSQLKTLSTRIPILVSANFSQAVNLLVHLAATAARALGQRADIEIVERHHRFKKDAPSGTALRLADSIAEALDLDRSSYIHGRHGITGERPTGQIGLHALRTGDNPGEHTVVFGLMGECLELSHRALNRDGFARGALDAARFLAAKPPGLYSMRDLLGFA